MVRSVPAHCLSLLHVFEGKAGQHEALPTQDPGGRWEIGWGHRISGPVYPGAPLTRDQADHIALNDLGLDAAACWTSLTPGISMTLTEGQWGAVLCFAYNVGAEAFRTSTMCRLLRLGQIPQAAAELDKWIFHHDETGKAVESAGLRRRRASEKAMFLS